MPEAVGRRVQRQRVEQRSRRRGRAGGEREERVLESVRALARGWSGVEGSEVESGALVRSTEARAGKHEERPPNGGTMHRSACARVRARSWGVGVCGRVGVEACERVGECVCVRVRHMRARLRVRVRVRVRARVRARAHSGFFSHSPSVVHDSHSASVST
eukprot:6180525-Pleurochrysis_carterae.AAC.1